jgi:hypothetical protein
MLMLLAALVACTPYAEKDDDGDGVTNGQEETNGTDVAKADTDGDGLSDGDEAAFGSDPLVGDTDQDGLTDDAEQAAGSSPIAEDTDGDGYSDADEVDFGSDPADNNDFIYDGGWPYNRNKDDFTDPGWDRPAKRGEYLPRFTMTDQFGDTVDIYDFIDQGKPLMLDLSGLWCSWCHEVADFIDGEGNTVFDGPDYAKYASLPEMVANGEVYWITVIDADEGGQPATEQDAVTWAAQHPNPKVPVLADTEGQLTDWFRPSGYPTMALFDDQLEIVMFNKQNYQAQWDALLALKGQQ